MIRYFTESYDSAKIGEEDKAFRRVYSAINDFLSCTNHIQAETDVVTAQRPSGKIGIEVKVTYQ